MRTIRARTILDTIDDFNTYVGLIALLKPDRAIQFFATASAAPKSVENSFPEAEIRLSISSAFTFDSTSRRKYFTVFFFLFPDVLKCKFTVLTERYFLRRYVFFDDPDRSY